MHFSFKLDEQLIGLVRQYEELYSSRSPKYTDSMHKNEVWKEIGAKVKRGPELCKQRWESLRSQYRKIRRFRKVRAGQAADNDKKWRLEDQMEFLLPYMRIRASRASAETVVSRSDDNGNSSSATEDERATEDMKIKTQQIFETAKTSTQRKRKCETNTGSEMTQNISAKYYEDEDYTAVEAPEKDALDYFFECMKSTVRTFSAIDRHFIKMRIFNTVTEMELKYLNMDNSNLPFQEGSALLHSSDPQA